MQLESRKNTLEIELKERLRRQREELQARLDALGEPDEESSTDDLEKRTRELRSLNNSIQTLGKKVQGLWFYSYVFLGLKRAI